MNLSAEQLARFTTPIAAAVIRFNSARSEDNRLKLEIEILASIQLAFRAGRLSTEKHPIQQTERP